MMIVLQLLNSIFVTRTDKNSVRLMREKPLSLISGEKKAGHMNSFMIGLLRNLLKTITCLLCAVHTTTSVWFFDILDKGIK